MKIKMTINLPVDVIQSVLIHLAEYKGPASCQYLKILRDSYYPIDYDWLILSEIYSQISDSKVLEEASSLAMEQKIIDVSKFEILVREVAEEVKKKSVIYIIDITVIVRQLCLFLSDQWSN